MHCWLVASTLSQIQNPRPVCGMDNRLCCTQPLRVLLNSVWSVFRGQDGDDSPRHTCFYHLVVTRTRLQFVCTFEFVDISCPYCLPCCAPPFVKPGAAAVGGNAPRSRISGDASRHQRRGEEARQSGAVLRHGGLLVSKASHCYVVLCEAAQALRFARVGT